VALRGHQRAEHLMREAISGRQGQSTAFMPKVRF
jgi:hypothetical protein